MAMKMQKRLINIMLLIVISICTLMHFSAADEYEYTAGLWETQCGNTSGSYQYKNGSAFHRNLNQLLDSLVGNVSASGFNASSVLDVQNINATVYGLLQCRGDSGSSNCTLCAETAKERLLNECNSTSGFIQLIGCFLRYDSFNFFNDTDYISNNVYICSIGMPYYPELLTIAIDTILANVSNNAVESPKFFAAESIREIYSPPLYIYSIAECFRDMSPDSCKACLALPASPSGFQYWCKAGNHGAQFLSVNCQLRFEIYEFFNMSILSPSAAPARAPPPDTVPSSSGKNGSFSPMPPPSPLSPAGKRSNVLRITLGIVAAVVGLVAVIGLCKWNFVRKRWERISRTSGTEIGGERQISLCPAIANLELIFKYDVLREATSNFKEENKLGQGGFGSVFKGDLPDGRVVAVKRLYTGSSQGEAEFLNEANLISCIQHRNLVKLLGCSFESSERLLVYEYLPNSSLDKTLFDPTKCHLLGWNERYEIIVGTARGLTYLHEESEIRIIHRDIKACNILLDNKYRSKIADFGLAKFFAEDKTHLSTGIAGTIGYMAPEYALRGQLTEKADVFSFGVLVLEIISGRRNHILGQDMEFLIERAWRLYKMEKFLDVMDPTLQGSYSCEEGIRVIKIGLLCTQAAATLRPSMSRVVSMLTNEREHLPSPTRPTFMDLENIGTPYQVKCPIVIDSDKTSSSIRSSEVATSSTTPSEIHPDKTSSSIRSSEAATSSTTPSEIHPNKTSSSNWSSDAATSSRIHSDIHPVAADPSFV